LLFSKQSNKRNHMALVQRRGEWWWHVYCEMVFYLWWRSKGQSWFILSKQACK